MLFVITAKHTAETCPGGVIRPDPEFLTKFDQRIKEIGITCIAGYLAAPEHTLWFVVDADSSAKVASFCVPLLQIGIADITPVQKMEDAVAWARGQKVQR